MAQSQIQCPNCGGYDVELSNFPLGCMMLMILGFVFWIIPGLIALPFFNKKVDQAWEDFWNGNATVRCKLCKREFYVHEIPSSPMRPKKDLIALGRQRLNEEEERARTAAWIAMQNSKKK